MTISQHGRKEKEQWKRNAGGGDKSQKKQGNWQTSDFPCG